MKHSRVITLLLILLVTVSFATSEMHYKNVHEDMYHKIVHTQNNLEALSQAVGKDIDRLLARDNIIYSYVARNLERKPNFRKLARANVRLKIGKSGGSGTVIGIEDDGYIYILTAKHCTPFNETKKKQRYSKKIKGLKLEVEIPMLDKEFDSGKGKDYLKGYQYVTVKKEDVYADEKYDIALFRFPIVKGHDLAVISPSRRPCFIGNTVYAVGNPIAMIDNITKGIYSCRKTWKEKDYMVISSGIIFGNSGGAVVNEDGDLVGVVSSIAYFDLSKPRQRVYICHLGMAVPQHIMIPFVLEAYENLQKEISTETETTN